MKLFDHVKPLRVSMIILFLFLYIVDSAFFNLVVFKNNWLNGLTEFTNGWINPTLTANLFGIFALVFIFLIVIAKLRIQELSLFWSKLPMGLLMLLLAWIIAQVCTYLYVYFTTGDIVINLDWEEKGISVVLGNLLAQLFGTALREEIIHRGLLISQIYLIILGKSNSPKKSMLFAVLISQLIFALVHIPNRIYFGLSIPEILTDQLILILSGIFFSLLFIVTQNLFIPIGFHTLMNAATPLFESSYFDDVFIALFYIVLVCSWPFFRKRNLRNIQNVA